MERVLVLCGAGASSSFLVHWMRRGASERGIDLSVEAGSVDNLDVLFRPGDTVLVGHHLAPAMESIRSVAQRAGALATLLPPLSFDAAGAAVALDLALDLASTREIQPRRNMAQHSIVEQRVLVASIHGLHARPASLFTQAASRSGLPVKIAKAGKSVNAASILGVISLGIEHNDEVVLTAEGDNAQQVISDLVALLATDLDGTPAASTDNLSSIPTTTPQEIGAQS